MTLSGTALYRVRVVRARMRVNQPGTDTIMKADPVKEIIEESTETGIIKEKNKVAEKQRKDINSNE